MSRAFAAALLAAGVLGLGACGGGDSSDAGSADVGPTAATGATGTTGTTAPDGAGGSDEGERLKLDERQEPVPKGSTPPAERSGSAPRYSPGKQLSEDQLKPIERPVFEQSRHLCRRLGIEGMKHEYRIGSDDPEEVARAVAARTYQREVRDAVYAGCLEGLRRGD